MEVGNVDARLERARLLYILYKLPRLRYSEAPWFIFCFLFAQKQVSLQQKCNRFLR